MTHPEAAAETLASEISRATIVAGSFHTQLMPAIAIIEMGNGRRMGGVITGETANIVKPPLPISASIRISAEEMIDGTTLLMTE